MGKKRIYELAKELNVPSKQLIAQAQQLGFTVKNHMSTLGDNEAQQLKQARVGTHPKSQSANATTSQASHTEAGNVTRTASSEQQSNSRHQQSGDSLNNNRNNNNHSQSRSNNGNRTNNSNNGSRSNNSTNTRSTNNSQNRSNGSQNRNNSSANRSNNSANRSNNNSNRSNGGNNSQNRNNTNSNRSSNGSANRSSNGNNTQNRSNGGNSNSNRNGSGRFGGGLNNSNGSRYRGNGNKRRNNKKQSRKNQRIRQVNNKPAPVRKDKPLPETLIYTVGMNAQDLGKILHREPAEIIKKLFMLGVAVNQNQSLDKDTIEILATDYGIEAEEKVQVDVTDLDKFFDDENKNMENAVPRAPVVTVMGHVDHGKTTLLDKLRHTHVTAGEAGGITQAIGAYQVKHDGKVITFLDTPGHAAFTEMRARGADITDITVLVVAADDGVMPQTIEAINHAKAANVPIIVAVNKIDKPGANPNHVIEQLAEYNLIPEDWGGDTIFVQISAKFGKNLDELLEMILLQAEVLELKANPDQNAAGSVLEASLDRGKGSTATLLVQQGTMHIGDPIVVGNTYGRVRTMTNDSGHRIEEAGPSTPIEITGLSDVPEAGDRFVVFDDEKTARDAGEQRSKQALMEDRRATNHVTLDNLFDSMKQGELKEVDVIIKADVQGSVEALAGSLRKIDVEGVRVNIIHTAVGAINESDVALAEASNAIIIGFNVRPTPQAKSQADTDDVDIRLHQVIYNAIDEIESAMKGMLEPTYEEKITGQAEIREIYKVSKIGTIGGGMVTDGVIHRDSGVRVIRDGVVIYDGKLASLRRFKDDVKEVKQGFELGLRIEDYNDIKVNDVIEAYVMKEVPIE
ncbi:translation initiation factor IF-2 [Lactiplantibacillus mudanjiangensis]|uniref:Translation initiation factor IF-2 n=1 Tax=Lactiplantibacillus mudanjiangensis TaxID=1296538 RepID=A0A660DZ01_9LACO|nr:translation initiation factor IF-2 [Lactiplantibacillus mudanjiangensis]VDG20577.1 translation initiation factor IF-2 [Lactobacillus sp.] [Lactiplantibacillus mudanjiangensis]VDG24568.1 translation initiation factor IF-2 [Lactobacillus sp.] [Lactiplantibacillus mudanjiangensis]VDG28616.1 translation initiation factor IF-2 [Lactobacillus sp.] [Lactiplantibacillus mudanjiangensis]VDG30685.1 translation initiation factor IF-2 [Lactobacillus sp.] [Lactiplantibacillus mudanjiangensis]